MPKSYRCNHGDKDLKAAGNVGPAKLFCANCNKLIVWVSINSSKKVGLWIHDRSQSETCEPTVATPVGVCYHDKSVR